MPNNNFIIIASIFVYKRIKLISINIFLFLQNPSKFVNFRQNLSIGVCPNVHSKKQSAARFQHGIFQMNSFMITKSASTMISTEKARAVHIHTLIIIINNTSSTNSNNNRQLPFDGKMPEQHNISLKTELTICNKHRKEIESDLANRRMVCLV